MWGQTLSMSYTWKNKNKCVYQDVSGKIQFVCYSRKCTFIMSAQWSFMIVSVGLDTSHHGPADASEDASVVRDSVTGIHNAKVKCLFVVIRSWTHESLRVPTYKNPYDSNLANVDVVQWELLYQFIHHDICDWENLTQGSQDVLKHHHACLLWLPEVHLLVAFGDHIKRISRQ